MRMGIGTVLSVVALMLYCGAAQMVHLCVPISSTVLAILSPTPGMLRPRCPRFSIQSRCFPTASPTASPTAPARGRDSATADLFLITSVLYINRLPAGSAQAFGFPFQEPYSLRLPDAYYSHGVNFAYSGGTALSDNPPFPAFYFAREVSNFIDFNGAFTGTVNLSTAMQLVVAFGGNDLRLAFVAGVLPAGAEISQIIDQILQSIKQNLERIHKEGARFFYIFIHPPAGCCPYYLLNFAGKGPMDEDGCLSDYNAAFQNLNVNLKAAVDSYRKQWPDTTILLFDWYNATLDVIRNPGTHGIQMGGFNACCGGCAPPTLCCNTSNFCEDPEHILYWDGIHYSEGFNRASATLALTGKFVDGPFEAVNLKAACNLDFSSFPKAIPNPKTIISGHFIHYNGSGFQEKHILG